MDTSQFTREHDPEVSFNKLVYQLLLHKFGKRYGRDYKIYVYLDERTTQQQPDLIRPMLNSALCHHNITQNPFRRITFMESKRSDLMQVNDLLIGAIGSRKNGHHLRPEAAPHKTQLGLHIAKKAGALVWPRRITSALVHRFTMWVFQYRKRS